MKILLINYEFPPVGGGAGTVTYYMAHEMAAMGHEVLVVTGWFRGLKRNETSAGFRIFRVDYGRRRADSSTPLEMLLFVIKACLSAQDYLKDFPPDIIMAAMAIPSGMVAWYLKKCYKLQYIISLLGGDVPGHLGAGSSLSVYHYFTKPITKAVWKNAKKLIANSRGLRLLAMKTAGPLGLEVEVIPNGIDLNRYRPLTTTESSDNNIKLLFVGRLNVYKGLKYLLEAMSKIKFLLEEKRVMLEIVGDGPLRIELFKMSNDLGIGRYVNFSGWCTQEEIPRKYQSAQIFILQSLDEGMPVVISEAMASGLAILSTDIKGVNELITDGVNGYLVKPSNAQELADRLSILLVNANERRRLGAAARKTVEKFSWRNLAIEYLKYAV